MKALVFAPNAVADIDGIYDHTEEFWGFEQAEDYTFSLRQACRSSLRANDAAGMCAGSRPGIWR